MLAKLEGGKQRRSEPVLLFIEGGRVTQVLDQTKAFHPGGKLVIERILDVPTIVEGDALDAIAPEGLFEKGIGRKGNLVVLEGDDRPELAGVGCRRIGRHLHGGKPAEPQSTRLGHLPKHPNVFDGRPGEAKILLQWVLELEHPREAPKIDDAIVEAEVVGAAIVIAAPNSALHRVVAGSLERAARHVELLDVEGLCQGGGRQQQGAADAKASGNHAFRRAPDHCALPPAALLHWALAASALLGNDRRSRLAHASMLGLAQARSAGEARPPGSLTRPNL